MLHYLMERQRQAELAQRAERARQTRGGWQPDRRAANERAEANAAAAITLRFAGPADSTALADLAGRDSAAIPAAPVLLAETGGEIRAALSLLDGAIVADPFHHTLGARELLRKRAAQLRAEPEGSWPRRLFGRVRGAARRRPINQSAAIGASSNQHR
jgi:hypothetical protein